jgi:inhibitor of cysteine peptidase
MKYVMKIFIAVFFLMGYITQAGAMIPQYKEPSVPVVVHQTSPYVEIVQPANPTTGYSWKVKQMDVRLLQIVSSSYVPPVSQRAGAGGEMHWIFHALPAAFEQLNPVETTIELQYARPWNTGENPKKSVFKIVFAK